jgi:hypothetical protein
MQRASRNIKKHVLNKGTIIDLILTGTGGGVEGVPPVLGGLPQATRTMDRNKATLLNILSSPLNLERFRKRGLE